MMTLNMKLAALATVLLAHSAFATETIYNCGRLTGPTGNVANEHYALACDGGCWLTELVSGHPGAARIDLKGSDDSYEGWSFNPERPPVKITLQFRDAGAAATISSEDFAEDCTRVDGPSPGF